MDYITHNYEVAGAGIVVIIIIGIVSLLVSIALFFLFRAITCWYFKINKLLKEQQKTNAYLERIAIAVERNASMPVSYGNAPVVQSVPVTQPAPTVQSAPVTQSAPAPAQPEITVATEATEKTCAGCGVVLPADASFCTQCGTPAGIQ